MTRCGPEEFQDVERYDGTLGVTKEFVDSHQAPVGQIQWNNDLSSKYIRYGNVNGVRWGTGTLISENLFLTAGIKFDQNLSGLIIPRINGTDNPIPSEEIAKNMKVNFNFQFEPSGSLRSEQSFAITELVEYRLGGLDYAIVKLDGKPGNIFGFTKISKEDANLNDMLCIIQHPDMGPKKVEAGPLTYFNDGDERIGYNSINTRPGTTGAGILLSPVGKLVGVHTNGGCDGSQGYNFGVKISSLLLVSPSLRELCFL